MPAQDRFSTVVRRMRNQTKASGAEMDRRRSSMTCPVPRPPCGPAFLLSFLIFQSTPPVRGATAVRPGRGGAGEYFNPRPPRGGRPRSNCCAPKRPGISIRAPREGGDGHGYDYQDYCTISIRAPREGGDRWTPPSPQGWWISIRAPREGGDRRRQGCTATGRNFNPRPPRGGRPMSTSSMPPEFCNFNPRPPRGGRRSPCPRWCRSPYFNPRPP